MAEFTRDTYGTYIPRTEGSVAYDDTRDSREYDLGRPEQYPDYSIYRPAPSELQPPAQADTQTQTFEDTEAASVPRSRQTYAPGAILAAISVAMLCILSVMARIQLTSLSSETVELSSVVSELRLEEKRLRIQHESAFNLTEIERFAIHELGMQRPFDDQVIPIDTSAPDKVVLHSEGSDAGTPAAKLEEFMDSVRAFFAGFLGR